LKFRRGHAVFADGLTTATQAASTRQFFDFNQIGY
jgi:hypothetical protein